MLIPILVVLGVIILGAVFIKFQLNKDIQNFNTLSQKMNGTVHHEQKGLSKYFGFLFPSQIVFNGPYSGIDFTVRVHDSNVEYQAGRFFVILAKVNFNLLPLSIAKKVGFFTLSCADVPTSSYSGSGFTVYGKSQIKNSSGQEIIIGGKKYHFQSKDPDKARNLLGQSNVQQSLGYILNEFKSLDINNGEIKLTKRWSTKDSRPEKLRQLFENVMKLAENFKIN